MPDFTLFRLEDFTPELRTLLHDLPESKLVQLRVALLAEGEPEDKEPKMPAGMDRHILPLNDGEKVWDWKVDSLQGLFRGDGKPPVLGSHPQAYQDSLLLLELHALELICIFGDRRDAEMLEVYSQLRRRPDGRSLGYVHDYMWQAVALMLGTRPLSQAEFEAILSRLERSCRTFQMGATSRNYAARLRGTLGSA